MHPEGRAALLRVRRPQQLRNHCLSLSGCYCPGGAERQRGWTQDDKGEQNIQNTTKGETENTTSNNNKNTKQNRVNRHKGYQEGPTQRRGTQGLNTPGYTRGRELQNKTLWTKTKIVTIHSQFKIADLFILYRTLREHLPIKNNYKSCVCHRCLGP